MFPALTLLSDDHMRFKKKKKGKQNVLNLKHLICKNNVLILNLTAQLAVFWIPHNSYCKAFLMLLQIWLNLVVLFSPNRQHKPNQDKTNLPPI